MPAKTDLAAAKIAWRDSFLASDTPVLVYLPSQHRLNLNQMLADFSHIADAQVTFTIQSYMQKNSALKLFNNERKELLTYDEENIKFTVKPIRDREFIVT